MVFTIRGLYHGNIWPNSRTICCQCPGLIMTHPSLFPHLDELIRSDKTKEAEKKKYEALANMWTAFSSFFKA